MKAIILLLFLFCIGPSFVFCDTNPVSNSQGIGGPASPAGGAGSENKCDCPPPDDSTVPYQLPSNFLDKYTKVTHATWKSGLKCQESGDGKIQCSECHRTVYEKTMMMRSPFCQANKEAQAGGCKCPSNAPTWNSHLRRCVSKKDYPPDFDKYTQDSTRKSGLKCHKDKHLDDEIFCSECHFTLYLPKKKPTN